MNLISPPPTLSCPPVRGWTLERLKAKDSQAWRAAFYDLWKIAYATIKKRIFSTQTAEDLAQEVLLKIRKKINTFHSERHIEAMAFRIAQTETSHFLRNESAQKRDRRKETPLEAVFSASADERESNLYIDLETCLAKLDTTDRSLVEGKFYYGLNSRELEKRTGIKAATIRGRLSKAVSELRAFMASEGRRSNLLSLIALFGLLAHSLQLKPSL